MNTDDQEGAFGFGGTWREFAPIAFTNLLLCIVTLGIYTFWARTRERKYLWSQTRFIDDRLEWTGTGLELFIGYLIAFVFFVLPLVLLNFGIQALTLRGHFGAASLLFLVLYFLILYVTGIAIFRALRYRLSRTFWRGIRGGSDQQGFGFGLSYVWRTIVGSLVLGLMIPWSMVSLWNERWKQMSFGPIRFESGASYNPIFKRFLLFYLAPVILFVAGIVAAVMGLGGGFAPPEPGDLASSFVIFIVALYILFFVIMGAIALVYYSAYFREVVGHLSLGNLEFEFTARTGDWFRLVMGNLALVVFTLGIGQIFVGYRNWSFFIRHMRAFGDVNVDELTQSTTREPGQGEGLLDAFDVGAF